jgi:general secretion pathway protein J
MMRKQAGFTLIEILIALMIFAIMGVLAAMSLHTIIRAQAKLKKADHALLQLQITMTLLRRDISQVIDRKVRDGAAVEPAFAGSGSGIAFTRTGLFDPFNTGKQSNMQRVGYVLRDGDLMRLTGNVLDALPYEKPASKILLQGVESITWQFIARDGRKSFSWPTNTSAHAPLDLPKVVLMVMHLKQAGVVQGVFPIPARGAYAPASP